MRYQNVNLNLTFKLILACSLADRLWQIGSDAAVIYPEGAVAGNQGNGLAAAVLAVSLVLFYAAIPRHADVVAFNAQEWWWAAKDGYLDTMILHLIRNGGL